MARHPLTSKERRGLTAVAAAALLCTAVGLLVRSCRPAPPPVQILQQTASEGHAKADSAGTKPRPRKAVKPSKSKNKKDKPVKTYPSRDYLDERERLND